MQIKFLTARNFVFQRFQFFSYLSTLTSDLCPLAAPSDFCQDA
jgi:hypothetical protein